MKKPALGRAENLLVLIISVAFFGYAVYRVGNIPKINFFEVIYTTVALSIAVGAALALRLPRQIKQNLLLLTGALLFSVLAAWIVLPLAGIEPKSLIHQAVNAARSKLAPPEVALKSRKAADNRSVGEVVESLRKNGIDAYRSPSLRSLIEAADTGLIPLLPLGGISRVTTVNCNEGDQQQFPVLHSDRYGYNNEDTVFALNADRILLLGDSFIYGQCVHQEQTVAGHLRRNGYAGISVGVGGNGPLFNLAALREYGTRLKPKTVVWFYTVGNDFVDLRDHEIRSRILVNYFDPSFRQSLADKQDIIDATWRKIWDNPGEWRPVIDAHGAKAAAYQQDGAKEAATVLRRLKSVLGDRGSGIDSVKQTDDVVKIIGEIFRTAKRDVESWGGTLYFAPIWGAPYYRLGQLPPHIDAVIAEAKAAQLPFVDIDPTIQRSGDHDLFFPVTKDIPHHNSRGYALFADAIAAVLAPKSGLFVLEATFGENCEDAKLDFPIANIVRPGNATQVVSSLCDGKADCRFNIGNHLVGSDPAGGCVKDFSATWMCIQTKHRGSLYVDKNATGKSSVALTCQDGAPGHTIAARETAPPAAAETKPATSPAVPKTPPPNFIPKAFSGPVTGTQLNKFELQYTSYVGIENAVRSPDAPLRNETASILGNSYVPKDPSNVVRITVEVPALAARESELIVGIFLGNAEKAVAHTRHPIAEGNTDTAIVEYLYTHFDDKAVGVDIRIGVNAGGKVFLNGDIAAKNDLVPQPTLVVEEFSAN